MLNKKALAGTPSTPPVFVEDVFSTYLYTGNATARSIVNDIDLSGKGGLVWTKSRSYSGLDHYLVDTVRGNTRFLNSNSAAAQTNTSDITAFNNNGYSLNNDVNGGFNNNGVTFCSWTFREQPKFFDVVTYTGDGSSNRQIAHNLGSVPGMMIVKQYSAGGQRWNVYHRSASATPQNGRLALNTSDAYFEYPTISSFEFLWNLTQPTSTVFTVGSSDDTNQSGQQYVAYLFAHNAGGFGTSGTDNVISCGSFTTNGSGNATVSLGYEPQYVMFKRTDSTGNWFILDVMRGWSMSVDAMLRADLSNAESSTELGNPTATGFYVEAAASASYIYMAIRRPMKVPTTGTSVFSPNAVNVATGTQITTGFPVDWQINFVRTEANYNSINASRLQGVSSSSTESGQVLWTAKTDVEASFGMTRNWGNTGFQQTSQLFPSQNNIYWNFCRAPGFFDVVCYTGTGSTRTVAHNLGVAPELMIVKSRNASGNDWMVYQKDLGANQVIYLNYNVTPDTGTSYWNNTNPTSSVFTVANNSGVNGSGSTYVAYLFATCAGVSKVFSYTGNGSSQTINCAFTAGARFVMIKRTDSTGDWYVWDTARGIVSGNDPHLSLNTTAAEVTSNDSIDPDNSGFIVNQLSATNINVSSATYIGIAVA